MLNKKFWEETFGRQGEYDISRRKIIAESSRAQHASKQAIFALQRGKESDAKKLIAEAEEGLISLDKRFGQDFRLRMEGSWKASVEEFCEAKLFYDFWKNGKIDSVKGFHVEPDELIGALSDTTGEIVRMMIIWTTRGELDKVKKASEVISAAIHELMKNSFGGYLRTKFDQAKKNMQKAEQILYDLSIRDK
mgnify:FL=1|jgi:predicted translin family RNA/ssDNA-binding protein